MIVSVHSAEGKRLVTVVDSGILGKKFEEGNLQLDLTAEYYGGEEKSLQEIEIVIRGAYIVQFIGEKSVSLAKKLGFVGSKDIVRIGDVPHAQVLLLQE